MCSYITIEQNNQDLECRRLIMRSIELALKRGDEVLEKFVSKEQNIPKTVTFQEFKESLNKIDHKKLK